MKLGRLSQTAEFAAFARAFESRRSPATRLFNDPFAYAFLRSRFKLAILLLRVPILGALEYRSIYHFKKGPLSLMACRTRIIDDYLCAALRDSIAQVVILGAGFDCRAYRVPGIDHAAVFEIDVPITLARKKRILRRLFGRVPMNVTYADADFNAQSLRQILQGSGFDPKRPAFLIWEGVSQYLTAQAVDGILTYVGRETAPGSRIVFTYVHKGLLDGSAAFADTWHEQLRRSHEPWIFGIYPDSLREYLASRGLNFLEDLEASELRERYMGPSARRIRSWQFYRVASASVGVR
jgi:methyltransferase (TIGR00027 family)